MKAVDKKSAPFGKALKRNPGVEASLLAIGVAAAGLSGCFTFDKLEDGTRKDGDDTSTETVESSDSLDDTSPGASDDPGRDTGTGGAETDDTGSDTRASDTDDAGADPGDTASDTEDTITPDGGMDAGNDTDTSTDTDTAGSQDTGSASGPTDSDATMDTGTGIDTTTETTGERDTSTETETTAETETDSCSIERTCEDWGFECGDAVDGCGEARSCGQCEAGYHCSEDNLCKPCNTAERCGAECEPCGDETLPSCVGDNPAEAFCACLEAADGQVDSCGGETSRCVDGECRPCVDDDACGAGCEPCIDPVAPICMGDDPETATCACEVDEFGVDSCAPYSRCEGGACRLCDSDGACGRDCVDCTLSDKPFCDMGISLGACVECAENEHCRDAESGVPSRSSPIGVCTPEGTCTCWADGERGVCATQDDCPSGYVCAQDYPGVAHYVCLRPCESEEPAPPDNGVTCEERLKPDAIRQLVWVPVTTCYAFFKFGQTCGGHSECRTTSVTAEGSCQTFDVDRCTYGCLDELVPQPEWCPDETCDIYCVP